MNTRINTSMKNFATTALLLTLVTPALAHEGRRFEVKVIDHQLVAHGYITENVDDDGGGKVRSYYNALHGHFSNKVDGFASTDLPGYDVIDKADELLGYDLHWVATGFYRWASPGTSGDIKLTELEDGEYLSVVYGGNSVDSNNLASSPSEFTIDLLNGFTGTNGGDLDLTYDYYGEHPRAEIVVITSVLTTDAPGITDSGTIYTILSPDGDNPMQRLHHPALYAESYFGTPVPEPGAAIALLVMGPAVLLRRRR